MKTLTRYQRTKDGKEVKAVFWNGEFDIYKNLIHEEPEFVAVLDDSGRRGNDRVKLWNKDLQKWEVCPLGNYIVKMENETFTVKTRDEIISELSPVK
jgi:hypothetical protein